MAIREQTFFQVALEEPGQWELYCGHLRRKPAMTASHNEVAGNIYFQIRQQLDPGRYAVRLGMGHVQRSAESYFIPDVFVVPVELVRPLLNLRDTLEAYGAPLPLVVEVWSPSTGEYDVDTKIPEYQARGDLEIWRVHPFDRTVRAWRRQADGSYSELEVTSGRLEPVGLPGVSIELRTIFD